MISDGDAERRRLIASVLAGELAADAPEVLAMCRQDPSFAAELRELGDLQTVLQQRGRRMQEDLREPAGALHGAAASVLPAPRRRPAVVHRAAWWLAAAAVFAAVAWSLWPDSSRQKVEPQYLGDVAVRASADGGGLDILHTLSAGQDFRVRVFDEHGKEIAAPPRFRTTTWHPGAELAANWSEEWTVQVEVEGADVPAPRPMGKVRGWKPATKND